MIEMPLNHTTQNATPNASAGESAADAPEGAFAEMLSRNLGRGLVRRASPQNQESDQDAAQGGTQFYQGAPITPWLPTGVPAVPVTGTPATPGSLPLTGTEQAAPQVGPAITPAARAVAARLGSTVSSPAQSTASVAATDANGGAPPGHVAGGAPGAPNGQAQIDDPWQGTPLQTSLQPASARRVATGAGAPQPTHIGEPSSEPGVLDSPRLETVAATASTTAPAAPTGGVPGHPAEMARPAAVTLPHAPTAATAASAAVAADPRAAEQSAEPATPAAPVMDTGGDSAAAIQAQPQSRLVAAPNTQLVNRVLRMVEFQQTQPPPRMVVVDMPELEGLRLMVAIQADGKVHVAPIAGSAPQQVAEPFMQAVGEALSAEGFDLAANSQQRQRRDRPESDEPAPTTRRTARRRRATGLRL